MAGYTKKITATILEQANTMYKLCGCDEYAKNPHKYAEDYLSTLGETLEEACPKFTGSYADIPSSIYDVCHAIYMEKHDYSHPTGGAWVAPLAINWLKSKIVYSFQNELDEAIAETSDEIQEFSPDILSALPCDCFAMIFPKKQIPLQIWRKARHTMKNDDDDDTLDNILDAELCGAIILRDSHYLLVDPVMYSQSSNSCGFLPVWFDLGETKDLSKLVENAINKHLGRGFSGMKDQFLFNLRSILPYLVYLCAKNADISWNEKSRRIYKKRKQPKNDMREVRIMDVGKEYAIRSRRFRQAYADSKKKGNGSSTMKAPHVRRAHYAHHWYGSEAKGTRHVELIWIEQTYVHKDLLPATATTIVKV